MQADLKARCAPARPLVFNTLAAALRPAPRMSVAEWAENVREVAAESGSPFPGKWRNHRTPHLVAIMEALGPDDPAEDVVFVKSAQIGGSEVGVNFFGFIVTQDPGPMLIVLPSYVESTKYVAKKLQPAIDATPALKNRVLETASRTERGSTISQKNFRGGFAQITFAGSSKGLQMLSARYTLGDEVSEWPATAGDRGDPVEQLKTRTEVFEHNRKRFWVSTPSVLGTCRVTADYETSDKQKRYVPCPGCGAWQLLKFENLKWESESWPHRAWFQCISGNGCVIEHVDKGAMLDAGVWLATAGEGGPGDWFLPEALAEFQARIVPTRVRGFHIWQAYSKMVTWDSIVAKHLGAKDNPEKLRVFFQQVLGEAWEDRGEAPDAEQLHKRRVEAIQRGSPPTGPVVLTGATDVQGNRLEWAVWGWSEGMTRWLVDWGVIPGDPTDAATWVAHDEMMSRARYAPGGAGEIGVDAWAVDTGYVSHAVYNYARSRPRVFAVDGRGKKGRAEPFVGVPKRVDVRWNGKTVPKGALLWGVGGFALKSDLYGAIRKTINGPDADTGAWRAGSMILPGDVPLAYAEQLTAEHLVAVENRNGLLVEEWQKLSGRPNEALDIACYARAMAYHLRLDRLTNEQWAALRTERCGEIVLDAAQPDLFAVQVAVATPAVGKEAGQRQVRGRRIRGRIS
jgi:phage terminase large subunit GpA-like protein